MLLGVFTNKWDCNLRVGFSQKNRNILISSRFLIYTTFLKRYLFLNLNHENKFKRIF